MSRTQVNFTLPTGRFVQGDLYTPNDKKPNGMPMVDKAGNPYKEFFIAVAIPKTPQDLNPVNVQVGSSVVQLPGWVATAWGALIMQEGFGARPMPSDQLPRGVQFAWKIKDGDSTELGGSTPPKRYCDYEGFKGCWVVSMKTQFPIRCYNTAEQLLPPNSIKRGDYIQLAGSVVHNEDQQKPGVYLNAGLVMLIGYGNEINGGGIDIKAAGFNPNAPLPAGASATPHAVMPVGGAPVGVAIAVPSNTAAVAVPQATTVTPHHAILPGASAVPGVGIRAVAVPGQTAVPQAVMVPPTPAVPIVPAVPVVRTMTPKANGVTYEQFIGTGQWTDDLLRQHGYMV